MLSEEYMYSIGRQTYIRILDIYIYQTQETIIKYSITVKGAPFSPMIGSLRFNLSPASLIHLLGNLSS
jgi:hypothetical protein